MGLVIQCSRFALLCDVCSCVCVCADMACLCAQCVPAAAVLEIYVSKAKANRFAKFVNCFYHNTTGLLTSQCMGGQS